MILKDDQKENLLEYISEVLSLSPVTMKDCREVHFATNRNCPHCESSHISKFGKINEKQ